MKIASHSQAGNMLVMTLITCLLMGMGLASYLTLVQAQNRLVVRSRTWNAAIPAAEAGIEEALTHLNVLGDAYRGTNGWSSVSNQFVVTRDFGAFRYSLSMDSSNQPIIYSTGFVRAAQGNAEVSRIVRVTTTRFGSGMRGMVALGNITMNGNTAADSFDGDDPNFSTNGRYDANRRKDNSYVGSVHGNVDTGNGKVYGIIATGPNGLVTGNAGDFAWLLTHSGIQPGHYQNDLNVAFPPVSPPFNGGAGIPEMNGQIITTNYTYTLSSITTNVYPNPAPTSGVTTATTTYTSATYPTGQSGITTNTAMTSSRAFPTAGTYVGAVVTRVVSSGPPAGRGTWYDYSRITGYNYVTTVYTYNLTSTNMVKSTNTYTYVLRTGNYQLYTLSMSGNDTMIVVGDAVLYTENGFSMSGNSQVTIIPGASLKLYSGGDVSFSGNGIINENADARYFSFYGLPSNTDLSLSGNASFTGTIYAPSADFRLNGGGNNIYDLVGASVSKTVAMHGHFKFHYDERLGRSGGRTMYRVASWHEL